MADIDTIAAWIERARETPIRPWLDYAFETIPFAVYDDSRVAYIHHPSPPDERPVTLMAATAIDIGGLKTATLPASMCPDEAAALPLAYHEGFHVYQAARFVETPADMFTAMAYYPELVAEYRALCRLEADVLNDAGRPPQTKLAALSAVIRRRREILASHVSLAAYERFLERSEGTAAFVEQTARLALYGVPPEPVVHDSGWSRFYKAGAALCWLLDAASPGWQARVEAGESPGDIALAMFPDADDLSDADWNRALESERAVIRTLQTELHTAVAPLEASDALIIVYPAQGQVFRAFSPATLQSLGDGRILHRTMFKLLIPDIGHAAAAGVPAIDDIARRRVILPARTSEYDGDTLTVHEGGVDVSLKRVYRNADGSFRLLV